MDIWFRCLTSRPNEIFTTWWTPKRVSLCINSKNSSMPYRFFCGSRINNILYLLSFSLLITQNYSIYLSYSRILRSIGVCPSIQIINHTNNAFICEKINFSDVFMNIYLKNSYMLNLKTFLFIHFEYYLIIIIRNVLLQLSL